MGRLLLMFFIICSHFAYGQFGNRGKLPSRYNFNYIQLQSKIKKNIAHRLDVSFVKTHFMVKDSLKFDILLFFDEKGNLKNDKTIVNTSSNIFNEKIVSTFNDYPQLLPENFPFSTVEFEYQVLTKLEYIVNDSYRLIEVEREDLWRNIFIDIHPSEEKIIEYVKSLQSYEGWDWNLDSIKVPIYFTLNNDYKLTNVIVFSDSELIKNKVLEYINDINNCIFYIALDTNKNYSAIIKVLAHKSKKSYKSSPRTNVISDEYYSHGKSPTESFPIFQFCKENNLIDKGGICFLYAFEEYIYTNIDQNIIRNINGPFPLKAKIKFNIDATGNISEIKVSRSKKILKEEILIALKEFPQIEPGKNLTKNSPIGIRFEITMLFNKNSN